MKEEYLHFAHEKRLFGKEFITEEGLKLEILEFGELNRDSGPDFLDAKIFYKGTVWAGPIEFHVKSSDWYLHRHQKDPNYNNVIAHFVYEHDKEVCSGGYLLPTVTLKSKVDNDHFHKYKFLLNNEQRIPCEKLLAEVPKTIISEQQNQAIRTRLWKNSLAVIRKIDHLNGDREKSFLTVLAKVFGGRVNSAPFMEVIERIEMRWLARLNYSQQKIEALFLGLSNLLPKQSDEPYLNALIAEFSYQRKLFGISELTHLNWRYSTMRPTSFPEIRMAQLVGLLIRFKGVSTFFKDDFSRLVFLQDSKINLDIFWSKHYTLKRLANRAFVTSLSHQKLDLILINAVVPYIYAIGLFEGNIDYKEKAIKLLQNIRAENNSIIKKWKSMNVEVKTAYDSQSLLETEKWMCNRKKCLFCAIGKSILNK